MQRTSRGAGGAAIVAAAPAETVERGGSSRPRTARAPRGWLRSRRLRRRLVQALVLVLLAVLLWPAVRRVVLRPEQSRPLRGRELAATLGCFACHGAEGRGGVANPGSRRETIPGFTGGTLMMYVRGDDEIRQYILDGRPDRLVNDPDYDAALTAQAIRMPAFRGALERADVDTLVAYVRVVSGLIEPDEPLARRGLQVARRMGCFGCHGELGMGGRDNLGSLKGYVPGFMGRDLRELARDDGELREWIRAGHLARIDHHPIGGWFARRQRIKMPAFAPLLSDEDTDALVALLRWINRGAWQRAPLS